MSQRLCLAGLLALLAIAAALPGARAADLDEPFDDLQPPPLPQTKVEFGSGWYVRGDIGATAIPKLGVMAPALPSSASGLFVDNPPSIAINNASHLGYTASIGAGYAFPRWFRTDVVFDFHQPISTSFNGSPFHCQNGFGETPAMSTNVVQTIGGQQYLSTVTTPASSYPTYGTCTGAYAASLTSYDTLINGYVDLGKWFGIVPYVGAGIGLSFGHYQTSAAYTQADGSSYNINITDPVGGGSYHLFYDRSSSGEYYNFAFALMAGVSYDIFSHTKLDVGYRYLHLGSVLGQDLTTQEIRAGLRYMIDN